jgi:hypothetical protein
MMANRPPETLTPEERRQRFAEFNEEMGKLTPAQRDQMREAFSARREQRFQKELNAYFAMTPEQKIAHLNEQIKKQEERAKQWEQRRAEWQASQQNSAAGGGSQGGPGGSAPGNGQTTSGGTSGGPPDWRNATIDQRTAWRQQNLNQTTPVQRAQRVQYNQDMQAQRAALGLPPTRGPQYFGGPGR